MSIKIVGISGSLRTASYNTVAVKLALQLAHRHDIEVEYINLQQLDIPLFNEDLKNNDLPTGVKILRDKIDQAQGLIIATPEYNHSLTGVLKNAIDWISLPPNVFSGKIGAILSASTSGFGGVRAQLNLRLILSYLNVLLISSPEVHISNAQNAFTVDGQLTDSKLQQQLQSLVDNLINLINKFNN